MACDSLRRFREKIDSSPYYRDTRLFLEALLRQSVPSDARLTIGQRARSCASGPQNREARFNPCPFYKAGSPIAAIKQ